MTWKGNEAVKLRIEDKGPRSTPAVSVPTAFKQTVDKVPEKTAMGQYLLNIAQLLHHTIEVDALFCSRQAWRQLDRMDLQAVS